MAYSQKSREAQKSQEAETSAAWGREFLNALADSSVVYISDVTRYGWTYIPGSGPRDGWEAIGPTGEIACFATRADAQAWRMAEVREFANYYAGKGA